MNNIIASNLKVFTKKKLFLPLLILLLDIAYYAFCIYFTLSLDQQFKVLMIIPTAFAISFLFLIGHDAAHNSFTKYALLNQIIARVVFLPTFHSYTAWCLSHNRTHHAHTNLKDDDDVFNPLSKKEFDSLSYLERSSYKFKRTMLGHGWMYFQELWLTKMIFVKPNNKGLVQYLILDLILLLVYGIAFFFFLGSLVNVLFVSILPFLIWNWLMGWVTYQQHTHPLIKRFKDKKDWDYTNAQITGTMHVVYPELINMSFHYIMEHTVHHLRPDIPMYHLKKAQHYLEAGDHNIPKVQWSIKDYLNALKKCKLYDYENNQWIDYNGKLST